MSLLTSFSPVVRLPSSTHLGVDVTGTERSFWMRTRPEAESEA